MTFTKRTVVEVNSRPRPVEEYIAFEQRVGRLGLKPETVLLGIDTDLKKSMEHTGEKKGIPFEMMQVTEGISIEYRFEIAKRDTQIQSFDSIQCSTTAILIFKEMALPLWQRC